MVHPQVLTLNDISYEYPSSSTPLFEHISVTFPSGWTAVLGDNGIGKTTLMQIVIGHVKPDSGSIAPKPGSLISAYCPQRTDEAPENLEDFAVDWSPETLRIRETLGIGDDWAYRYDSLSGGEAKRLQLACALSLRPDLLILDEPTNHVDEPTRLAIAEALRSFSGIGIVVSHDVDLIEAACSRCVVFERRHMKGRNVTAILEFAGGYADMTAQVERRDHAASDAAVSANKEANRLRHIRAERFQQVQKADAIKRHGERIDARDHDARERRIGAKALSLDANPARQYAQLGGRLAAADERAASIATAAKRYDGQIWFDIESSHRRELVHLPAGVIYYGSDAVIAEPDSGHYMALARLRVVSQGTGSMPAGSAAINPAATASQSTLSQPVLSQEPEDTLGAADSPRVGVAIPVLSVGPRDHIGITGPNGGGKTTIVNAVLRSLGGWNDKSVEQIDQNDQANSGGEMPYLMIAQNTTDDDAQRALAQLLELPGEVKSQVLSSYAQLNANPDRLAAGTSPSPGELRKLLLCLGIAQHPQLIIMDEPTNHLDLHSKQALAAALQAYSGALMVVSHERWFLRQVASTLWEVG
ncbi:MULTISPECIES: ATP-binding cassette domain-containing protein [Bifidobacterium]|jgi:ATPase subunit of ABC transporter with duplicated ATPase domains|uniref:ABC transporter ATP-binding protein n=1 Tax=Bifidobacterium tibiigranuli TaxID=2172043 RepID=A0A5N6S1K8_9BIFI|nr:ATP-binding cassette domain-containing protein [Bifidobacterium tibiigranuli]KAE8127225.1 ABC transporter ATP-binding protein [Bifidobacterium tibiigranuli]KAE8127551.1 ABC transporter ATP-binding protein [Bifidobacterium tibiigranuli]MCI1211356.1 ATP-binding cassette domain-containing protein [Bifidobacterium tibiigranuli]